MEKRIREILDDLYALDPALREMEDELKKTVRQLLSSRPETGFDEKFRKELLEKLIDTYGKKERQPERPVRRSAFRWRYAVALAAVIVVAVVTLPLIHWQTETGKVPVVTKPDIPGRVLQPRKLSTPDQKAAATKPAAEPKADETAAPDATVLLDQLEKEPQLQMNAQQDQYRKQLEERARQESESQQMQSKLEGRSVQEQIAVAAPTPSQMPMNYARPKMAKDKGSGVVGGVIGGVAAPQGRLQSKPLPPPDRFTRVRQDEEWNTEGYDRIQENDFLAAVDNPLSTFSIDVDTASYANVRRFLANRQLPPPDAVRIEELVNYFPYEYPLPKKGEAFSITTELSACPWNRDHQLVLVGLQGRDIPAAELPPSNLVFLIDVSGSMSDHNKLPLLKEAFKLLVRELDGRDRVAIVVYAGSAGMVLPTTRGDNRLEILDAIDNLQSGGSTAGGAGIRLAYKTASESFIKGGNNRVILATDGDFNVGASSDAEMERLIESERQRGIFLTVLGFGMGNYKDAKMEKLADQGNGNYAYIDSLLEANKVLVTDIRKTLFTIAKDVKIQIEFNPAQVQSYRLLGYENRLLKKEDFDDDTKDAGEIGSGHTVTAFYEIVPAGAGDKPAARELKYQKTQVSEDAQQSREIMTVKIRYKQPDGDKSALVTRAVDAAPLGLEKTSENFRFAASVAEFGLLLRDSRYKGTASFPSLIQRARAASGNDPQGYRHEFTKLVQTAEILMRGRADSHD